MTVHIFTSVHSLIPKLLWGRGRKEPGTHSWHICELCHRIDHKIIPGDFYDHVLVIRIRILQSIHEREREREREMASGELKSKLNLQLRRPFSAACSSLGTPSWPLSMAALTRRFHRLSTWSIIRDTSGETTSTTLQLAELQLVLLCSLWLNTKGSVS